MDNLRFVVKTNSTGVPRFRGSYKGAESMYTTLEDAKRQAREVGDKVYQLEIQPLLDGVWEDEFRDPCVYFKLVFTREEKK